MNITRRVTEAVDFEYMKAAIGSLYRHKCKGAAEEWQRQKERLKPRQR